MLMNKDSEAIEALDLTPIKTKLMHVESGEGWSRARADAVEVEYRRFLHLMKKYPNEQISPTVDVDTFWHYHILDTMKYAVDCEQTFGYFLHHYPYVGIGDDASPDEHEAAGERMHALYEAEFGEPMEARTPAQAWCASAVRFGSAAWCAAPGTPAANAWCASAVTNAKTAWCAAPGKPVANAWCASAVKAKTAWCAAPAKPMANAWCASAVTKAKTAWCAAPAKPVAHAWCASAVKNARMAWCASADKKVGLAWLAAGTGPNTTEWGPAANAGAAWCASASPARTDAAVQAPLPLAA
jgi:hypothetical protein